jgi:hypothetical protein
MWILTLIFCRRRGRRHTNYFEDGMAAEYSATRKEREMML